MENREKFSSRIGFLLISAGCAIGLGNVWRFPFITGQYGGAAFVLIYLFFLIILGLPILVMEYAVGRASQKSIARSFQVLEPKGTKWHWYSYVGMAGNYLLMMFYTTVAGWMISYFFKMLKGDFVGKNPAQVENTFGTMLSDPKAQIFWMLVVIALGFLVCSLGLQNGVEKITTVMMSCLFIVILVLIARSVTLDGASAGLKFYLIPDFAAVKKQGVMTVVSAAMGQAFFTLSLGIGAIAIFGSYIDKSRRLTGEAVSLTNYGEQLLPYVNAVLNCDESLKQEIAELNGLKQGKVKIGVFSSVCTSWLPEILHSFKKKYTEIDIEVFQGTYDDVVYWIKNGVVDLGFLSVSSAKDIPIEPLYRDELLCVLPSGTKENKSTNYIDIEEMKHHQFVTQRDSTDADIQNFLKENSLQVQSNYHVVDDLSTIALVEKGFGICLMPKLVMTDIPYKVDSYPTKPPASRIIGLAAMNPNFMAPAVCTMFNHIVDKYQENEFKK